MKIFALPLAFLLIVCAAGSARAADFEVRAVDLYPSGAKFTFAVTPEAGDFQVELPGAFRADSVRLLGDAEGVRAAQDARAEWIPPALAELNAQAEAQARTVSRLAARKAALEQTQDLLKSLKPGDGKDLLAYIQEAQAMKLQVENDLIELNAALEEENEKLERLQGELEGRKPQNANALLRVTGRARTANPLLIEAFTPAARWAPRYTMDLNSATGEIETRLYARATQRTGLDYAGPVTFHTKRPDENVTTPNLTPLRVGLKPKLRAEADYAVMEAAALPMMSNAVMKRAASAAPAEPEMESTLADRAVRGNGALTGDGREAEFVLGDLALAGKPQLILIPEQRDDAWIVVSMDSVTAPLIPGRAELRVDGQPAGSTSLPEYGLGQTRIPFGYAPQVTAKKEPIVEKKGTSWFSGVFTGGYTLEVTNGMREDRTITVRDRLPIPTDDKVTLSVKRIEPEPKERDPENRLTWELPVKAGESVKILVDYTLSYPSGEELQYRR